MIKKLILTASVILCLNSINYAQEGLFNNDSSQTFLEKNINLTGEAGALGEVYSMSGSQNRRPNSTGTLYLRPSLNLFGLLTIPFDFFVSTEGSAARQELNRYGIAPAWSWGKLYLGDFSETHSDFTLSGINVRGAGLNLFPGAFRFALAAGLTQRDVQGGADNGSFKRFLISAKLGYGYEDNSHFYLTFLKAKDKISHQPLTKGLQITSPNGNDEIPAGYFQTIKWLGNDLNDNVKILLSRDGGSSYEVIINSTPNTGFYNWNVTGPETFNAIIKIISLSDSTVQTQSTYPFRIGIGIDYKAGSIPISIVNDFASTPKENLMLGFNSQLNLFDDIIKAGVEGTGSIFTQDLRATTINLDTANIPTFLKSFYKPNISTNIDYAINSFLNFNLQPVNLRIGYKFIGPGFNSLGLSYLINDQQEITTSASINIMPVVLFLNYGRYNDNLINQKSFTTIRNQFGFGSSAQITNDWNSSAFINLMDMGNNSSNDTTKTKFNSLVLNFSNNFIISQENWLRMFSLNYSFQNSDNSSFLTMGNKSFSHSMALTFNIVPVENLTSSLSINFVDSKITDTIKTFSHYYTLTTEYPLFENKLKNSISLTTSFQKENTAANILLSSSYMLTKADYISLQIAYNGFSSTLPGTQGFHEIRSSLNIAHRF